MPHEWKFMREEKGEYSGATYYLHECRRCTSFVRWPEAKKPTPDEGTIRIVGGELQDMTCEEVIAQKVHEA